MQQHNLPQSNKGHTEDTTLKPIFQPEKFGIGSIPPAEMARHFGETAKKFVHDEKKIANEFPISVFPTTVQQIINETNETLNFPKDFIGAALLYAVSVAIGNTHLVEVMKGWIENALIYVCIVGHPGTNKSHPLSFALRFHFERDKQSYKEYKQQDETFKRSVALSKKERAEQLLSEPVKPVWNKFIVSDFTPEALAEVHKHNLRGIGVYADEMAAWFKNFNRYHKGGEQEFWLSNWSRKPIIIDRKSGEPTFIPLPFIPVIGTIQNAILNEIGKDSRNRNGFIDRILFVLPEGLKKHYWSERELNPSIVQEWEFLIKQLLGLPLELDEQGNPVPTVLTFSPDAWELLKQWQQTNTDLCNKAEGEDLKGIYSKIEVYAVRLCLIFQLMSWAADGASKTQIDVNSVLAATTLIEYFRTTAEKVNAIISNFSPLDKLPSDKYRLYEALPDTFTTAKGLEIAASLNIPKDTFNKFLRRHRKELFEQTQKGEWIKLL